MSEHTIKHVEHRQKKMERQLLKLNSELSMINLKLERLINMLAKSARQLEESKPCTNADGFGCGDTCCKNKDK